MAIQNRDAPVVIRRADFDPGKVSPGEIIIVEEDNGKKHAFVGLSAGEPVRLATHAELKSFGTDARLAASEAADARAVAVVQFQEAAKMQETAAQTLQEAQASARQAIRQAQEAAERAERALSSVNAAISGLSATLSASLASVITDAQGGGS